jgi:hypothetical protein
VVTYQRPDDRSPETERRLSEGRSCAGCEHSLSESRHQALKITYVVEQRMWTRTYQRTLGQLDRAEMAADTHFGPERTVHEPAETTGPQTSDQTSEVVPLSL